MAIFPSAWDALDDLLNAQTVGGHVVTVFNPLPGDFLDQLKDAADDTTPAAAVNLYLAGGNEGLIDRTDRIGLDVYAPGAGAKQVAQAIHDLLVPDPGLTNAHDTAAGYIDNVVAETLPADVPYADELVTQAHAVYLVTSRPIG